MPWTPMEKCTFPGICKALWQHQWQHHRGPGLVQLASFLAHGLVLLPVALLALAPAVGDTVRDPCTGPGACGRAGRAQTCAYMWTVTCRRRSRGRSKLPVVGFTFVPSRMASWIYVNWHGRLWPSQHLLPLLQGNSMAPPEDYLSFSETSCKVVVVLSLSWSCMECLAAAAAVRYSAPREDLKSKAGQHRTQTAWSGHTCQPQQAWRGTSLQPTGVDLMRRASGISCEAAQEVAHHIMEGSQQSRTRARARQGRMAVAAGVGEGLIVD
mmetsp:Transcript_32795/g.93058  ORF Transcript_32795/g.93058 Transcript_32795/m.93058 type:complete len:268 (+) Transcript_32795:281-1084(+)|eukprot:CAMPEP_0117685430 /NCGR_PEP_ID=MMETSP0804-20121206/21739_1 /TAXON_ID=1074897 /ORGANISM="Tetraselmis astigmatica, Strain CCMP880" /LENGTH=267 /DNA_ID=CAMNT_0005496709 /DNA_START=205 /DNA_END=1008 /DNA_ORIENTATION=+